MTIYLKAGSVDLKESEAGLTDLLDSTLVRGGTEGRTPVELAVLLDDNAIRLSVDIGLEETAIRLSTLTPDWEKGLAVLKEVLDPAAVRRQDPGRDQGPADGRPAAGGRGRLRCRHAREHDPAFQGPPVRPRPAGRARHSAGDHARGPAALPARLRRALQHGGRAGGRHRTGCGPREPGAVLPGAARRPRARAAAPRAGPDPAGRDADPQTGPGPVQDRGRAARDPAGRSRNSGSSTC